MRVRQEAHNLGLRYRLHRNDLPGTPDLTFPRHRKVLFVHGCFWHRHPECVKAGTPKTRTEFWQKKFAANMARDNRVMSQLQALDWEVLIIWECETKKRAELRDKLTACFAGH